MNRPLQELYDWGMDSLKEQSRLYNIAVAGGNKTGEAAHERGVLSYTHVLTRMATLYADQLDDVVPCGGIVEQFLAEQRQAKPDPPVVVCKPTPEPVADQESGSSEQVSEECPRLRWEEFDDPRNQMRISNTPKWKRYSAASARGKSNPTAVVYCVSTCDNGHAWSIARSSDLLVGHLSKDHRWLKYPSPAAAKAFCQELEQKAFEAKHPPS